MQAGETVGCMWLCLGKGVATKPACTTRLCGLHAGAPRGGPPGPHAPAGSWHAEVTQ